MKLFAPNYYRDFSCIAEKCRHSCCVGWEIDIDNETAEYYRAFPGEFGEKLRGGIDFEAGCFKLCEKDRCPFLNEKGLCEIIINAGEESLCQICTDHPRFRNFFGDRTEIGLGLCCEAAAKLIIDKKSKTELVLIDDDGEDDKLFEDEKELLKKRAQIFEILQNREEPVEHRTEKALAFCKAALPQKSEKEWVNIFLELERLDEEWTAVLNKIGCGDFEHEVDPVAAEQLLCYFFFRHLSAAADDGLFPERAAFCVLSYKTVAAAAKYIGIYEAARLYSSEIEYSDENITALLEVLSTAKGE